MLESNAGRQFPSVDWQTPLHGLDLLRCQPLAEWQLTDILTATPSFDPISWAQVAGVPGNEASMSFNRLVMIARGVVTQYPSCVAIYRHGTLNGMQLYTFQYISLLLQLMMMMMLLRPLLLMLSFMLLLLMLLLVMLLMLSLLSVPLISTLTKLVTMVSMMMTTTMATTMAMMMMIMMKYYGIYTAESHIWYNIMNIKLMWYFLYIAENCADARSKKST